MPISDWFKAREDKKYTPTGNGSKADMPDGVWAKCPSCKTIVYEGELTAAQRVCPHCGHHIEVGARDRVTMLADEGTFVETRRRACLGRSPGVQRGQALWRESGVGARAFRARSRPS